MKRKLKLTAATVLLLTLIVSLTAVGLAKPSNYDSGFQVQNLSSNTAQITMTFYNRNGTIDLQVDDTIDPNSSNTYFPLDTTGGLPGDVSNGFEGSVVISSNEAIAAIANIGADNLTFGASYNGFTSGSAEANLPLLMSQNFGFDTWVSVQNTGSSATDITITYSDSMTQTETSVAPGAAAKFDQATENHGGTWVGSATISTSAGGSGSIAATVMQEGPTTLFAYGGFGSGAKMPIMPIYQANNFGFHSGIQIQNLGSSSTDVTVSYTADTGTSCNETRTVPAGQSISFGLYVHHPTFSDPNPGSLVSENCVQGELFVGSAAVTANSANQDLVGVVNQLNFDTDKGSLYDAFDPADGTSTVIAPLVMDRNYGFLTGLTIVNAGANINAGDITCTYTSSTGSFSDVVVTNPDALANGDAWIMLHANSGGPFDLPLGDGFVGSGTCVGPSGSSLFGIVNELNTSGLPGDTLYTYEATNK